MGAGADAEQFHRVALGLSQSGDFFFKNGAYAYSNMLGIVYWLFGPYKILGSQVSILAFAISCVVLIKILRELELSRYGVSTLLVFGALPAMVFFGSVALREPLQILFFMLAFYFGVKMYTAKCANIYFALMLVSAFLMGILHKGLIVYAVFLVALFVFWTPYPSSSLFSIRRGHIWVGLAVIVSLGGVLFIAIANPGYIELGLISSLSAGDPLDMIMHHREFFTTRPNYANTRAAYNIFVDFSSPLQTVHSLFLMCMYFWFAPFPWQIKNILDVYGSMESVFRMILIYCAVKNWHNAQGVQRRLLGLMLILFFSMSFLWAIGTANYGTAARHNVVAWWIISIVGVPYLVRFLKRFRLG